MNSRIFALALIISTLVSCSNPSGKSEDASQDKLSRRAYSLAIHGGAGTITKANMTPEKEAAYTAALDSALTIGENILKK
jgi:beta-aspartyl-peptidase (threonine type)